MTWRKRFCFLDGEAIRQENGAARCDASGKPADAAGARRRETHIGLPSAKPTSRFAERFRLAMKGSS